ncbi:TetR/AcrR family transcriptional repressor of mexJK operon [Chitinophaga dinghuensis]|uniref:TetR/AcrR family transcriptional repressor of mexJK operon n=1 Tax=Chitinophaga dinghuensis TaxID=1539050 RepID=A0A327W5T2_9BACT|nr:TetR/AcrR family transcriptional regulator [Chitinophaga dinghuensis]RAJ85360.1 TetR/AcrR family transcriptional repressor of mexJK operon [Chitinophaga dinghuensis]
MQADNKDDMRDKILVAALKRFTQYGASKTTMNEIAEDLRCSKASLYYYFPDKNGMHQAVLQKIGETYFQEMEKEAQNATSATKALFKLVEIRRSFISRFCRLELFKLLNDCSVTVQEQMIAAKRKEIEIHAAIIQHGVNTGEFKVEDVEKTAILLTQAMMGLRFTVPDLVHKNNDIDVELFERVMEQQKALLEIFVKGIQA